MATLGNRTFLTVIIGVIMLLIRLGQCHGGIKAVLVLAR
jgi:hypothetical protein